MNGGYDVDLFVEHPDSDLICTICRSVLRCPVRVACNHVFCKKCILEWIKRQETCPCCRKPISPSLMFVICKLSKAISRLRIKCQNAGCSATFPLYEEFHHSSSCLFQDVPCPHQGCETQVPRHHLGAHAQFCQHWSQLCPMGCGTLLTQATRTEHNCYKELRQQVEAQRRRHRAITSALCRKIKRMQRTVAFLKRRVALICDSLEVLQGQRAEGNGGGQAEGPGEGPGRAEVGVAESGTVAEGH